MSLGKIEATTVSSNADCILINSCAVTSRAVQDVRKSARKFYRENPGIFIIVTGCAVRHFQNELKELPGVVKVVPQEEKDKLADWIFHMLTSGELVENTTQKGRYFPIEELTISDFPRARPVVKVQDGCSRVCVYILYSPLHPGCFQKQGSG